MMIDRELERAITGRYWKDCPVCKSVRIELEKDKCQNCGGEVVNCWTCGTGKSWWYPDWHGVRNGTFMCPECRQNPEQRRTTKGIEILASLQEAAMTTVCRSRLE